MIKNRYPNINYLFYNWRAFMCIKTKKNILFFLLLIFLPCLIFAQQNYDSDSSDPAIESDWEIYDMDKYVAGDQTFVISIGTIFPVLFINTYHNEVINSNFYPPVGGTGSLVYNYFLNSNIYVGGEISLMFNGTLGQNTVYLIPIGLRIGYQFNIWRFDIPVNYTLGMTWHRYLNDGYFGLYMKAGTGLYYRFNNEWSFGFVTNWCWFPEWTNDPKKNVDGNIVDVTLSARYHF
jgi:hypothetical protein